MGADRNSRSRAHGFSALSTSLGVALTLGLLGGIVATVLIVNDLRSDWLSSLSVEVILADETEIGPDEMEREWSSFPEVVQANYMSADSASAELEKELGEPFMDFLGAAPLPAVLELKLEPDWMAASGVVGLSALAEGWEGRPEVVRVAYPKRALQRLESGFSDWTWPLALVALVLIVVVVAQILNVVRLSVFGRRHLIRSMELVGAPPTRIRMPFIAEAMGYGAVGGLLAYGVVVAVLGALQPFLSVLRDWGLTELSIIFGSQIMMGLLITGASARWAVSRYLGVRLDKLM